MANPTFTEYLRASSSTEEVLGRLDPARIQLVQPAPGPRGPLDPIITHLVYYGETYLTFLLEGDSTLEFWVAGTDQAGFCIYWYTHDPDDGPTIGLAGTDLQMAREQAMAFLNTVVH